MMSRDLPVVMRWSVLIVVASVLWSHAWAAMMIDMRGFPDTEGNCRGEGFQRNDTDCTQFFRCVDFNRNQKYTIFRFMCGPMAVFDESRSLCTGPELAVPACPQDQLAQFFVMMKPADPPAPPAPAQVTSSVILPPPPPPPPVVPPTVVIQTIPAVIVTETQAVVLPPIEPSIPVIEVTTVLPTIAQPPPPPPITSSFVTEIETTIFSTAVITTTFSTVISTVVSTVVQTVVPTVIPVPLVSTIVVTELVEKDVIGGFITIGDREFLELSPDAATSDVPVPSDVPFGILSQGDGTVIVIEEPGKPALTIMLPPGAILIANTTQSGGVVTNVANGLITTSTSVASFPAGTTFWIAILGGKGEIIRWQQVVTTMSTTQIRLPTQTFIGLLTIIDQRVITIGGWTYTIQYIKTSSGQQAYVILQAPPTTSTNQLTVTTTSTSIVGNSKTISGIIIVGGLSNLITETETSDLIVPGGTWLAVIPPSGTGVVTINEVNSQKDIQIQPGEILAILSPGQGVVTQVIQQTFTTQTSVIRIPGGSTVAVMKVGTDGQVIQTVSYTFANEITILTTVYSTVGFLQLTDVGMVSSIGQAKFTVITVTGSSFPIYFGVLNFYTPPEVVQVTEVVQPVTVDNVVTITLEPSITTVAFTSFITPTISALEPQTITVTQPAVTLTQVITQTQEASTFTQLVPGQVTTVLTQVTSTVVNSNQVVDKDISGFITIGDSVNPQQTNDIPVPAEVPLAVVSQGTGSVVTIEETGSPVQTFTVPAGAILLVNSVQSGGVVTNVASNTFTTSSTTVSFPRGTTFWIVTIGSNGRITSQNTLVTTTTTCRVTVPVNSFVGLATIVNQQIVSISNWVLVTQYITSGTTTTFYGVLQNPASTTNTITASSTALNGDNQFISGIIAISQTQEQVLGDLTVPSGQLLVVIPSGGQGVITVTEEGGARDDFEITPGSMLAILAPSSAPGSVSQVNNQIFTTAGSLITFPAGSTVSVLRIGTDGRLIRVSSLEIRSSIVVTTSVNSIVGIAGTSSNGVLTSIGSGRFTTQQVSGTFAVPLYFGVINFNGVSTTSFLSEALSGIVKVGDASLIFNRDESNTETVVIQPETTHVVLNAGDFAIIEEDGVTTRKTTFTIPSGSALGIVTSATGGQVNGLVNGYFTSSSSQLVFPSGAQFGILIVRQDGTTRLLNTITTNVRTRVLVPVGSLFGLLETNQDGVVSGVGSAGFTTQYLLLSDSTGPDVPATLGHVGVLHFREGFDFSRFVVFSTSSVSSDLTTLSGLVFVNPPPEQSTLGNLDVTNGDALALIPAKGQGNIIVTEAGFSVTYTVLPGQLFGVMNVVNGRVTALKNLVFTTDKTSISFGAGSSFGIVKIGKDGKMLTVTIMRTAVGEVTVSMAAGGAVGVVTATTEQRILAIGGADFVVKTFEGVNGAVGVVDLAGTTPPPAVVSQPTRPPQPPIAGPFALDCQLDTLHQFPLDCSRFYQCSGDSDRRTFFIFPCAPGLIFDEVNAQCKNPGEATCDDGASITDLGLAEAGNVAGFFQIDCSGQLFRYPLNCKNFYQCFKNEKGQETIYVYGCASGLVFDDASRSCLKPEETTSCGVSDNLFRSPSFVFQLRQKVDTSVASRARSFVQRLRIEGSTASASSSSSFVQKSSSVIKQVVPAQAGRGASSSKMTIRMSKEQNTGRQGKIGEGSVVQSNTKQVTRTFQERTFNSNGGAYGTRTAPRAKAGLFA